MSSWVEIFSRAMSALLNWEILHTSIVFGKVVLLQDVL